MAIIHANTVLSGSPVLSLWAPPCIFPPLTNQSLFCPFQGTKRRSTARAVPSLLRVPAVLAVSILVPAQPDLPGHPGLCAGRAGAHTCPHGRVGTLVLPGSLEATCCIWDREQSQCFTSPPTWADFLVGVFTIFPRWLPMGTSQAEMPVGLAVGAGEEVSSSFTCSSCCFWGAQLGNGGCTGPPFALEPCWEAHLSLGTSGFRSILLERLRFACPCKSRANLLSNFGIKAASPGLSHGESRISPSPAPPERVCNEAVLCA